MTTRKIYRLTRYRDLLLVQAAFAGGNQVAQVRLIVDTGSAYTVLRVSLLEALVSDRQNPLGQRRILTGGGPIAAPVVAVP